MRTIPRELVRVFEVEPELLPDLPPRAADDLRRHAVARVLELERGDWRPPVVRLRPGDLALLLLDGMILRHVEVVGRAGVELLGSGDVVRPWRSGVEQGASVPASLTVKVCQRTRLAVLDQDFVELVAQRPAVLARILDRVAARSTAMAFHLAIARLPQLETRLLCLLWHLADRWGRVGHKGVVVRLTLSQATLADLVSAGRPSVSSALGRLERRGAIAREGRGTYRLLGRPPTELDELRAESQLA